MRTSPSAPVRLLAIVCFLVGAAFFSGCASNNQGGDFATRPEVNTLESRTDRLEGRVSSLESAGPRTVTGRASRLSEPPAGYNHVWMALPSGSEDSSAVLVEKMVPMEVTAGASYEYMIKVTNLTDNLELRNVRVMDEMGSNVEFESSDPQASVSGGIATWTMGSLMPNDSETITVRASAQNVGDLETCAMVEYTPVLCLGTTAVQPELSIAYSGTPDNIYDCDTATYAVIVSNTGTGPAEDVVVEIDLPNGLESEGSRTVTRDLGTLQPGAENRFTFTVNGDAGTYTSMATATSSNAGSVNSGQVSTTICDPMVSIEGDGPNEMYLGNTSEFVITVTNPGDCEVLDAVATAMVPNCTTFVSASDGGVFNGTDTVTWDLGDMASGASREITVRLSGNERCDVDLDTMVSAYCAEDDDSYEFDIVGIPAILLEAIDEIDPVRVGGTTTYVITATNQGSSPDNNVTIKASVEDFTIDSVEGPSPGVIDGKSVSFEPLPVLDPKEEVSWRVNVTATDVGDQRFSIEMTSDNLQRPVIETEATRVYE